MDSYVPGKSQDEIAADFGVKKEDIIKLGSNENPWGPSPKAMKAIEDEIGSINRYPESQLHELVGEIARYSGVKDSQVIRCPCKDIHRCRRRVHRPAAVIHVL